MSSPARALPRRKGKGRQKVNMAKMENQSNLQVTFSKRRAGLFKKASELCTLCGAQVALIVFSPANKVYCFGHPNLQTIIDNFLNGSSPLPTNGTSMIIEAHRNSTIRELNLELTQIESMLRAEKIRGEKLDLKKNEGKMQHWFPPSYDRFKFDQLSIMKESILELTRKMDVKVEKEMFRVANPLPIQSEKQNPRVFGFPFNIEQPNGPRVNPTFNDLFSLGTSNFSPFDYRALGLNTNNYDLFPNAGAQTWPTNDPLMTISDGTGLASYDHRNDPNFNGFGEGYVLMNSGDLGGSLFLHGNNSTNNPTSSMFPFDYNGNRGLRDGFGTGYDLSMFQKY